jgi:predicted transcriptional regulator
MSNRELVIDLVQRFPEDTPLLDIAHEIEFIAGVKEALAEADRGEGTPAEQVQALIDSWATPSS